MHTPETEYLGSDPLYDCFTLYSLGYTLEFLCLFTLENCWLHLPPAQIYCEHYITSNMFSKCSEYTVCLIRVRWVSILQTTLYNRQGNMCVQSYIYAFEMFSQLGSYRDGIWAHMWLDWNFSQNECSPEIISLN